MITISLSYSLLVPYSLLAIRSRAPTRALALARFAFLPIVLPVVGRADTIDRGRTRDARRPRGIEHHDRLLAFRGLLNCLPQQLSIGADRLVGSAEMFAGAILNRTHRLACPLIVHVYVGTHPRVRVVLLLVRIEPVVVALVLVRYVVGQLVKREALTAHLGLVDRGAEAGEDRIPVVLLVIDRHVPLRNCHLAAHRDDERIGKHQIGHAHMRAAFADLSQRHQPEAEVRWFDLDARARDFTYDARHRHVGIARSVTKQFSVTLAWILVVEEAMQE